MNDMNKTELIQAIADKTSLEPDIIKKVINACENVLVENALRENRQPPKFEGTKMIRFANTVNMKHKTN